MQFFAFLIYWSNSSKNKGTWFLRDHSPVLVFPWFKSQVLCLLRVGLYVHLLDAGVVEDAPISSPERAIVSIRKGGNPSPTGALVRSWFFLKTRSVAIIFLVFRCW